MTAEPTTLGEKLAQLAPKEQAPVMVKMHPIQRVANWVFLAVFGAAIFWYSVQPVMDLWILLGAVVVWVGLAWLLFRPKTAQRSRAAAVDRHFLLAGDRQGVMVDLSLRERTAVIDGSNIYHFGHQNQLDAQVLGMIADQLRAQKFRIVCFFDASIFYTLSEHGAFLDREPHSWDLLCDIFGLNQHEIYVVPSGVQADKFILSCLRHLPKAVAVTNDQFRDYTKTYSDVMKGDEWRKGIFISKNEIKMHKHRFKEPLFLA
ncbi:hypothetical protein [Amylibacter sp. IMCC11727]|uniref:NYN domain-containing protein n=1 Tax=Amylibacter sp. IMCC11727 TaxID=3039851 RepID=UPI00244DD1BB|nr:hypothetical protein [Amylibacter sp. IMCC11727]WGI22955.1 hypothetical protein QBD29_05920 [Amylibacter sp. IMCC11727]